MATTTPRIWNGVPTLAPEKIRQIVDEYRSNLADSDKADGDTVDYYMGACEALETVLDLLYDTPLEVQAETRLHDANVVTLHIGITRDEDNEDLLTTLRDHADVKVIFVEGDSWELWGEPDTEADNGHVVIEVTADTRVDAMVAAETLGIAYGHVVSQDTFAVKWVVSDADVWSELLFPSNTPH